MGLYAVLSTIEGPDGNGILLPFAPSAGGIGGGTTTTDNSFHLCTGAILPPDLQGTDVEVVVMAVQGLPAAAPSGVWRARIGATVVRNGNTLTIHGNTISSDVRSTAGLSSLKAELVVDNSVTPNTLAVRIKGLSAAPKITWQWRGFAAISLAAA